MQRHYGGCLRDIGNPYEYLKTVCWLLVYIFTTIAVICGAVVFSICAKWFLNKIETFLKERVNNRRVHHV